MSNIYILEPPTSGKVLLKTTVGDIDIELWAKETPKTCRNFIQLCMEGYYDNTIFHRVIKGFIAQGGDPNGDGTGGESIYGEPFKDEFHQRLRFNRRGIVAMANAGKDDNASQFFFTLGATPELQNKHTIFGKIAGDTVFNMLKLEEGIIKDERPEYPHKILKTEVLHNPFSDIVPRAKKVVESGEPKKKKKKEKGVKNFKLLSFGEEAEVDEEENIKVNEQFVGKGKSSHDVLDDPKLSSAVTETPATDDKDKEESEPEIDHEEQLENIRKKLKTEHKKPKNQINKPTKSTKEYNLGDDEVDEKKKKLLEIQQEIASVKKEYHGNKLKRHQEQVEEAKAESDKSETFRKYKEEYDMYKERKKELPKKGASREQFTLSLLNKFKEKLHSAKEKEPEDDDEDQDAAKKVEENTNNDDDDIDNDATWLSHKLKFDNNDPILAKDANKKDDDWYEVYDPRNPLNKRRRGEDAKKFKK